MNDPVLGDMYTDEHDVQWIYAGKAGWRRVVEPDTKYSDITSDGGYDPRDREPVSTAINENKRDFMQWYMLSWVNNAGNSGTRSDALYQASIAAEVYERIEAEAKEKN